MCGISGISAAQVGLILTYTSKLIRSDMAYPVPLNHHTASLTQACSMLTRQSAEVEVSQDALKTFALNHY